jgi:hypothetical protein
MKCSFRLEDEVEGDDETLEKRYHKRWNRIDCRYHMDCSDRTHIPLIELDGSE